MEAHRRALRALLREGCEKAERCVREVGAAKAEGESILNAQSGSEPLTAVIGAEVHSIASLFELSQGQLEVCEDTSPWCYVMC